MKQNQGKVYWITGLSASGKTTLATALHKKIAGSILIDGDAMRKALGTSAFAFDSASRFYHGFMCARMSTLLANQGCTVIIATISLYTELHAWNRKHLPNYVEVFLDIPEEIRRQRDPKKLYAKEKVGTVNNMAGLQVDVDFPISPDFVFDHTVTVDSMIESILKKA